MITLMMLAVMLPALWVLYLAIMQLDSAKKAGRLSKTARRIAVPLLAVGLVVDVLFNLIWGTVLFLDVPRELLFTSRVSRLNDGDGWRGRMARWVCCELLDPFDPDGQHCK